MVMWPIIVVTVLVTFVFWEAIDFLRAILLYTIVSPAPVRPAQHSSEAECNGTGNPVQSKRRKAPP
jgi:hypothetical protein